MNMIEMTTCRAAWIIDTAAIVWFPLPGPRTPDFSIPNDVLDARLRRRLQRPVRDTVAFSAHRRGASGISTDEHVACLALRVIAGRVPSMRIPATHRRVRESRS